VTPTTAFALGCALLSGPASAFAVGVVRRHALRRGVLDVPSHRSSHAVPTPRGGGVGVVAAVLAFGTAAVALAGAPWAAVAPCVAAVAAVAVVGWADDRRPLGVRERLAVHLAAAVLVAAWAVAIGATAATISAVGAGEGGNAPPIATVVAAAWWAFWTVAAVNVVNFMDGIDGLIGSQMVVFGVYLAALGGWTGPGALVGLTVAAASLGFLRWNWAPARIFLGDAGSGAYGVLAVVAGAAVMRGAGVTLVRAFLPLAPLFVDAAVTLVRRHRAGEAVTTPHRNHLYQRLANGGWGHARTSLVYGGAAAAAALVGLAPSAPARTAGVLAYAVALLAAGRALDRRVPYAPVAPSAAPSS
jgi:Fuc2NAc and GlcNAc transferase